MLNRAALIVRPAAPFLAWAKSLDDSGAVPNPAGEQTVYLIPGFGTEQACRGLRTGAPWLAYRRSRLAQGPLLRCVPEVVPRRAPFGRRGHLRGPACGRRRRCVDERNRESLATGASAIAGRRRLLVVARWSPTSDLAGCSAATAARPDGQAIEKRGSRPTCWATGLSGRRDDRVGLWPSETGNWPIRTETGSAEFLDHTSAT
jgi:hypothetical protein